MDDKVENTDHRSDVKSGLLWRYDSADFVVREKVRFIHYLNIALIGAMFILLFITSYIQSISPIYKGIYLPVLIPIVLGLLIFLFSYYLLIKGFYNIAGNLLLISSFIMVWLSIWFDKSELLARLDTIMYIFPPLAMIPLLIGKRKSIIFIYSIANIIVLLFFVFTIKPILNIDNSQFIDYLLDTIVPIIFMAIVGFNIYRINIKALNRAEADIKERKEAEIALSKSERRYREMTDLLPQTVFETDINGMLTYVNKTAFETFGYTQEDFSKGINIFNTVLPHELSRLKLNISKLISGEQQSDNFYSILKKDGNAIPVRIYANVIVENAIPCGFRGIMINMAESIKAEKALRQSEELFKTIIEAAPNAMALTDINGRYILVNKAFTEEIGYSQKDVINKTSPELGFDFDTESGKRILNDLNTNGYTENIEAEVITQNGKSLILLYSGRIIQLNNEPVILSSTVNITEKKKNERELDAYRNNLELLVKNRTEELATINLELSQVNKQLLIQREELENTIIQLRNAQNQLIQSEKMASIGILAAGVAHEINNPLNFISGGITAIKRYFEKENMKEHRNELNPLFDAINKGVIRTSDIVRSLNRYSRQNDVLDENCNIHAIIDDCLVILNSQIKNRIKILKEYSNTPFQLIGNEGKLSQAILNILTNAIQAIEHKGNISIKTTLENSFVLISIMDTGKGIHAADLNKIFDPFYTTKAPGEGTGLGLSITYQIINDMKGEIKYVSEIGSGTEVIIKLPVN